MLVSLSSPPEYITPEARDSLTSSTPSSFQDIPPILRFQEDVVEVSMASSRGFEGFSGKQKGKLWVTEE